MLAMTQISEFSGSIPLDEINQYVGGIYLQVNYNFNKTTNGYDRNITYSLPKRCTEVMDKAKSNILLRNYECPQLDSMEIKGNDLDETVKTSKSFIYTVHNCDVVNQVRELLGEETIECKAAEERDKVLSQFYVASKVLYEYFDPTIQYKDEALQTSSQFTNTTIISGVGQVKTLFVGKTTSTLRPNLWYDVPFTSPMSFETYQV